MKMVVVWSKAKANLPRGKKYVRLQSLFDELMEFIMLSFLQNTQKHGAAIAVLVRIKILENKGRY
jgi:hypothetical protein